MSSGVFVGPLAEASPEALVGYGSLVENAENANVVVLYVPAGMSCTDLQPIECTDAHTRLFIRLENGAAADVAVLLQGSIAAHDAEVILGDETRLSLTSVNIATGEQLTIRERLQAGEGARSRICNVTLGSAVTDHTLIAHIIGHDGESNIDWMCYGKEKENHKLNVRNIFDASNGRGEILMRGISEDKAHIECKGMIEIGLKGGGTNTYLTQEVLMLDATAKVDAIPALEIKTNDVKASHSATIARVTEEDLFYFGARGISPEEARKMFILGFLGSITERITRDDMREMVLRAIEEKYVAVSE